jgi:hypothetical protein
VFKKGLQKYNKTLKKLNGQKITLSRIKGMVFVNTVLYLSVKSSLLFLKAKTADISLAIDQFFDNSNLKKDKHDIIKS